MSKKRNYDAFKRDQQKANNDDQIPNLESRVVSKKNKADLNKLDLAYAKAEKAKCSAFIDIDLLLKITSIISISLIREKIYIRTGLIKHVVKGLQEIQKKGTKSYFIHSLSYYKDAYSMKDFIK